MKTFNISDEVSLQAQSRGQGKVPESGVYVPNYKGVNHLLYQARGSGEISFWSALAETSAEAVRAQTKVYQGIELSNAYVGFNRAMMEASREFKSDPNNISGQGYTEHITSTHEKLSKEYIDSASSLEVANNMKLTFAEDRKNWANKAFQEENEMMVSHAVNKFEENSNALLMDVMNNPDNVTSIQGQYGSVISTLEGIVPANKYERVVKESGERFTYFYGMGLIKKDPYSARELIEAKEFRDKVDPESYLQLVKNAETGIKHIEEQIRKEQKKVEDARDKQAAEYISDLKVKIEKGMCQESDIDSLLDNGWINKTQYNNLIVELEKSRKKRRREVEREEIVREAIEKKMPLPTISLESKNKYFNEMISGINEIRVGAKKGPMSFTEIINYAKENAIVFDGNNPSLSNALVTTIMNGEDGRKVMDACIAVYGNEQVPAIRSVNEEIHYFARYAVEQYKAAYTIEQDKAAKNLDGIIKFRDMYFTPQDERVKKVREEEWKVEKERFDLEEYFRKEGLATDGWIFKTVPKTIKGTLEEKTKSMLERLYKKTGSMTIAKNVTTTMLLDSFKNSNINGEMEPMYNPPRKENTGLEDYVIRNMVGAVSEDLVDAISKAKDSYKGNFKIRKIQSFVKTKEEKVLFEKPVTIGKTRPIEVLIGDKWERRNLKIEAHPKNATSYSYYFLIDEKDPSSKEYLLNPKTGRRYVHDFNKRVQIEK